MYEKKIKLLNDEDRFLLNTNFRYNALFGTLFVLSFLATILLTTNHYYENIIEFLGDKKAIVIVSTEYLQDLEEKKEIYVDNNQYKYNIDKIEKKSEMYFVTVNLEFDVKMDTTKYQLLLSKEKIIKYILRIIKGGE